MLRTPFADQIGNAGNASSTLEYWRKAGQDFLTNLRLAWLIIAFLFLYLVVSATLLYLLEQPSNKSQIHTWGDALYFTWVTMATVDNPHPYTWAGRFVTSVDVLMGLITIGIIVWVVTMSLTQTWATGKLDELIKHIKSLDGPAE